MRFLLSTIMLFCVTAGLNAAHFEHYAGGFRVYSDSYAEDGQNTEGPYSDTHDDLTYAWMEQYAELDDAFGYSFNNVWDINDTAANSICIRMNSFAQAVGYTNDSYAYGYGFGSTEDEETFGVFYQLMPDNGEQVGDKLLILCTNTNKIAAWGTTLSYTGGPDTMNRIVITKGQMPPVISEPNSIYEVWAVESMELNNEGYDGFVATESFFAQVGDVIGVFAENYTDVTVAGLDEGLIESDMTLVLTAKTILAGDLDEDGDVDLDDFAQMANNWLVGAQ